MALNIPNIAPASAMGDIYDVYKELQMTKNALKDEALKQKMQEIQNQYMPENYQSQIDLRKKQIEMMPRKYELMSKNALLRERDLNQKAANAFKNWTQTPQGQKIIEQDPKMAYQVYKAMQQNAQYLSQNQQSERQLAQSQTQGSMDRGNLEVGEAEQDMAENTPDQPTDVQRPRAASARQDIDEKIRAIQQASKEAYATKHYPADIKKRIFAGARFKSTIPSVLENFDKAKIYFSPKGQLKLKEDEVRAAHDKRVPESLQAYRKFKQGLENLKVQGAFLEGVPADQKSREAYAEVYKINNFFNNPDDAYDSLKYAIDLALYADEMNKQPIGELLAENKPIAQMSATKTSPSSSRYTSDDIAYTAKKYGISEDEVKRRIGL